MRREIGFPAGIFMPLLNRAIIVEFPIFTPTSKHGPTMPITGRNTNKHHRNPYLFALKTWSCYAAALVVALGLWWNAETALAAESPAPAGWQSLQAMPAPHWDGKTLLFQSDQGCLAITPLSKDIIRVRFAATNSFGRDHSYAVVAHDRANPGAKVETTSEATTLTTASLRVVIQHQPLRISFADANG